MNTYKLFEKYHKKMYHASLWLNRNSILTNGLNHSGISPWEGEDYPKGTYLYNDIQKTRNYGFGNGDPFDIWEVDTSSYNIKDDPITKGAFFISEPISKNDIRLIESHENDVTNPINY